MGQCRLRKRLSSKLTAIMPNRVVMAIVAIGLLAFFNPRTFADPPQPAEKDSRPFFKPKNAILTTSISPDQAKPGETVTFKVTAKLDPGYHIYNYSKSKKRDAGPIKTTFDFFDTAGLKLEGDWTPSQEPEKHKDPNFADVDSVEYHENEVTWSIKLKIPEDTAPGKKILRCQAGYMVCDAKHCSVPGQWTLPDAELTVLAADGKGGPNVAAAVKQAEPKNADSAPSKPADLAAPAAAAGSPAARSSDAVVQSEIAQKAQQGLIPFLIASAIGGLFALVMPCVWPMVPITVNFFVKQGQGAGGRKKATGLAVTYCLAIIGIFTALGVFFSFFKVSFLQTYGFSTTPG